jgi:hypothetical protein
MSDNTGHVLCLRTCNSDMTSHGGFRWPESGPCEAPDWNPEPICGGGLHGLAWGEGGSDYLSVDADAKWLVVLADATTLVDIDGDKVKFPRGEVVYCGDRTGATDYIYRNGGAGKRINYGTATAGYRGTATAGDRGTATAGYEGTATAGDGGVIAITYWNGKRYKTKIAQVKDEDGDGQLEPNTKYRIHNGEFVKVEG